MLERKDLGRFAQAGVLAIVLAGCGTSANKSPDQTTDPLPTPSATEHVLPTQTPRGETPKPTEAQLSMEQQAANQVFDFWFDLLNSNQAIDDSVEKYYLKTSINNLDEWKHNIDTIKSGGRPDSTLEVYWLGGEAYPQAAGSEKYFGVKSQGFMYLTGINLSAKADTLTNEQKAQGIEWSGSVSLDFKVSWSENQYWPATGTQAKDLPTIQTWLSNYEQDPFWDTNPPIEETTDNIKAVLQNGKWLIEAGDHFSSSGTNQPLSFVEKPASVMADPFFCNLDTSSSCQVIKKNIDY